MSDAGSSATSRFRLSICAAFFFSSAAASVGDSKAAVLGGFPALLVSGSGAVIPTSIKLTNAPTPKCQRFSPLMGRNTPTRQAKNKRTNTVDTSIYSSTSIIFFRRVRRTNSPRITSPATQRNMSDPIASPAPIVAPAVAASAYSASAAAFVIASPDAWQLTTMRTNMRTLNAIKTYLITLPNVVRSLISRRTTAILPPHRTKHPKLIRKPCLLQERHQ